MDVGERGSDMRGYRKGQVYKIIYSSFFGVYDYECVLREVRKGGRGKEERGTRSMEDLESLPPTSFSGGLGLVLLKFYPSRR